MLKKTITYTDIDGVKRTEDFYFNLTKAELIDLEVSEAGGFIETVQALSQRNAPKEHLKLIKQVILAAYGERTDNGRHFIKKPEFADAFSHTEAYSILFMELFENASQAAEFFQALMPADLQAEAKAARENRPATQDHMVKREPSHVSIVKDVIVDSEEDKKSPPTITKSELINMPMDKLTDFLAGGGVIVEG